MKSRARVACVNHHTRGDAYNVQEMRARTSSSDTSPFPSASHVRNSSPMAASEKLVATSAGTSRLNSSSDSFLSPFTSASKKAAAVSRPRARALPSPDTSSLADGRARGRRGRSRFGPWRPSSPSRAAFPAKYSGMRACTSSTRLQRKRSCSALLRFGNPMLGSAANLGGARLVRASGEACCGLFAGSVRAGDGVLVGEPVTELSRPRLGKLVERIGEESDERVRPRGRRLSSRSRMAATSGAIAGIPGVARVLICRRPRRSGGRGVPAPGLPPCSEDSSSSTRCATTFDNRVENT